MQEIHSRMNAMKRFERFTFEDMLKHSDRTPRQKKKVKVDSDWGGNYSEEKWEESQDGGDAARRAEK